MSKRIFIVEDDESIRDLVCMALQSFSYEPQAFGSAEEALRAVAQRCPDLVIFDIMLPGMSGLEAIRQLRGNPGTRRLPILLLTAKTAEADKVRGLDLGADDYIVKPFGVMELGARLRNVFRRLSNEEEEQQEARQTLVFGDLEIDPRVREVRQGGRLCSLTFKEYELLCLLARERARVLTREELLEAVWGTNFLGESRSLDMHIRSLREKLGDCAQAPRYIRTVRSVGYRFIGGGGA